MSQQPDGRATAIEPRLGIAIVHYHAEPLLAACLRRLQASSMAEFRVHLVDCGSRDNLDVHVPDDPRFHVIHSGSNLGFAAGTNLALDRFGDITPWLLTLNPDVLVEADTIEHVIGELEADAGIGAATCKLELPSGAIDPACRRSDPTLFRAFSKQIGLQRLFPKSRRFGRYNLTYIDPAATHDIDSGSGAFLLMRRDALEAAGGGFDERFFLYGEDLDLCRRIRRAGYRILYTPGARATHIKGSGRIRALPATLQFHKAMWTYYRKWGRFRSNPLVLAVLAVGLLVLGTAESIHNAVKRRFHNVQSAKSP